MFDWNRIKYRAKLIRPLIIPLILYIGSLAFVVSWLGDNQESGIKWLVVLLPMLFVFWIAFGIMKIIGRLDEFERKTLTDGMAGSFAATLVLLIGLDLLEAAEVLEVRSVYILFFMIVVWAVGKLWGLRKHQ